MLRATALRAWDFYSIYTSKCASRHSGVHFSQSLQKCSETEVFLTCWLQNVLRATSACTFSTYQLPKVLREWGVFSILTSKSASRHNQPRNGSAPAASASLLFWPSGGRRHKKNTAFRDFYLFAHLDLVSTGSFSSDSLSSLPLSFHLCCFISPYDWGFDFGTSFANVNPGFKNLPR